MKKITLLVATLAFASIAQARPDTTRMTCQEAADLVQTQGAVVMTYAHHDQAGPLYKRFVKSSIYCGTGERAESAWAQTIDSPRCYVGKVCVQNDNR